MTTLRDAIIVLIREYSGYEGPLGADDDLFKIVGIDGDCGPELMELYSEKFGVNLDNYRWYFHHGEEGWSMGAVFFRSPDDRVERIPITLRILEDGVRTGRWPIKYPAHSLPKRRYDLIINTVFSALMLCLIGAIIYAKL